MFTSLDRGYEVRAPAMVFLLQARQFLWRDAAADTRYERLLKKMRFVVAG